MTRKFVAGCIFVLFASALVASFLVLRYAQSPYWMAIPVALGTTSITGLLWLLIARKKKGEEEGAGISGRRGEHCKKKHLKEGLPYYWKTYYPLTNGRVAVLLAEPGEKNILWFDLENLPPYCFIYRCGAEDEFQAFPPPQPEIPPLPSSAPEPGGPVAEEGEAQD